MSKWKEKKLGELGYTYSGLSGKSIKDFGKGKPFIPYMNIFNNSKIDPTFFNYVEIHPWEKQNVVKKNDLFFTTSSETFEEVGMTSVLLKDIGECYLNSFCFGFRLYNFDDLLPEFVPFLFRGNEVRKKISDLGQGSTRYNLPKTELLKRLKLKLPTLSEQHHISCILSTADAVIEKTKTTVAKYKAIKQGILHDLFTRGIDCNTGKLRPKYEYAPELYKDSKLGIIPRDWEVEKFKDITSILTCGVASTPKYVRPDIGVPFLSAQNVQSNGIVLEKFSYISKEFHQELTKNNKPSFGDILYSRVGAGYGQSAVVEFQWEFSVYVSLTLIRLIKGFNNYFYSHLLNSKPYKDKASINVFQGGGVPNLNVNEVRVFDMICPKITEQNMIAERLNSVDQKLHTEQTYLHKLQQLKAGLMGDLLSGRKKVMGLYSESIEKE